MSEDEALGKAFSDYLRTTRPEQQLEKLLKVADLLAKNNLQQKFIRISFVTLQRLRKLETFKVQVMRLMKLFGEVLQRDEGREDRVKYKKAISEHLIEIYTYIFEHIFKLNLTDLIAFLKNYRLQWAKRITDQCFDKLKTEIGRLFHNFDLDKVPEQTIHKIVRRYRKRGFKEHQISRYLPAALKKDQKSNENARKSQEKMRLKDQSESQSDSERNYRPKKEDPRPMKKVKKSESPERIPSPSINSPYKGMPISPQSTMPYSQNICPLPSYYQNAGQFSYPYGNMMPPNAYSHAVQPVSRSPIHTNPGRSPIHANLGYTEDPRLKSYPNQAHPNQTYPNQPYYYREESHSGYHPSQQHQQQHQPSRINESKHISLLKSLFENGLECRECGIYLSTQNSYDEHMKGHYLKSKQDYEMSHRKETARREALLTSQEWIEEDKLDLSTVNFRVLVKDLEANEECVFCSNEFVVSWSDEASSWVFENAIETEVLRGNWREKRLAHYDCHEVFNRERDSSLSR